MPQEVINLLNPILIQEETARYFYEAARTWARKIGYCGAQEQFKCYAHAHKHNIKCLMNAFADWNGTIKFEGVPAPQSYFLALPDVVKDAAGVEEDLMVQYNKAAPIIMGLHLGIFDEINKLRKRETGFYQEWDEYVDKLGLFNIKNPLDLVYFDRKILSWPSRK